MHPLLFLTNLDIFASCNGARWRSIFVNHSSLRPSVCFFFRFNYPESETKISFGLCETESNLKLQLRPPDERSSFWSFCLTKCLRVRVRSMRKKFKRVSFGSKACIPCIFLFVFLGNVTVNFITRSMHIQV